MSQNGLPLRDIDVPCGHCGCTTRRPDENRCACCGRFTVPLDGEVYVGKASHSDRHYHRDEDCPRLPNPENVRPKPLDSLAGHFDHCQYCWGDGL